MSVQYSTGGLIVASGTALIFDHIDVNGPMWAKSGEREESADVLFDQPFNQRPSIHLSIQMIDADSARNLRLQLRSADIRRTGFRAIAYTWNDTRIGRLAVSWMALGRTGSEWDV
ncbi:MAG: H-type lectin domain-containing protein [Pseudomonadota bacterium]